MPLAIGIDLGTTNCCVAVTEDGVPRVIQNRAGYHTTPSVVTLAPDSSMMIGRRALRRLLTQPDQTIRASKRLLGRRYDSEDVQRARERSAVEIVPGPEGDTRIRAGGQTLPIPAISAMLLQEMRRIAEADLGESIQRAVVTVPAYFTERQRQAVRDAGTIAGIQVLAIINEPTAAALSFGVRHQQPMTVAVYDLGGGTFDISIVRNDGEGRVSVLATTGDNFLGGEDFDLRIVQWLIEEFQAAHGASLDDRPIAVQRLRIAAEKARVDLSSVDETTIRLPFIITGGPEGPIDLVSTLTRSTLEELTRDLVDRTISICQRALVAASLEPMAIDEVLLVGGMTRTPVVRQALRDLFGRDPSQRIHPDEAVALGAALHAAALTGAATCAELDDVTAHPLGIVTAGGHFEVLIPANSRLPACRERIFTTNRDEQKTIQIIVMQGQSTLAKGNELLGEFAVSGLPSAPTGGIEVNVAFMIDKEGLFSASATNLATGDEHQINVIPDAGFDDGEIEHLSAERTLQEDAMIAAEEVEATRQRLDVLLSETARLVGRARQLPSPSAKVASTLDKTDRLLSLMHQALREGPMKDMSQEALVLQRTQRTLRAILRGEPSG